MFRIWDVRDMGCSRCGMWELGDLMKCEMLIYKIPSLTFWDIRDIQFFNNYMLFQVFIKL